MEQHPNARLTPRGRETLVSRIESGLGIADIDQVTGEVRRRGPVTPPVRHERERPGELVHVDVKKVTRILDGGGWRARGESVLAHPDSGGGYACLHVAMDVFNRVAHAGLLPDERKGACAAFMRCAPRFYAGLDLAVERMMTDNGPGYRRASSTNCSPPSASSTSTRGLTARGITARWSG